MARNPRIRPLIPVFFLVFKTNTFQFRHFCENVCIDFLKQTKQQYTRNDWNIAVYSQTSLDKFCQSYILDRKLFSEPTHIYIYIYVYEHINECMCLLKPWWAAVLCTCNNDVFVVVLPLMMMKHVRGCKMFTKCLQTAVKLSHTCCWFVVASVLFQYTKYGEFFYLFFFYFCRPRVLNTFFFCFYFADFQNCKHAMPYSIALEDR